MLCIKERTSSSLFALTDSISGKKEDITFKFINSALRMHLFKIVVTISEHV